MDLIQKFEHSLQPFGNKEPLIADQFLLDRMRYYHVPGVSIAVIEAGILAWVKGYGVAAESGAAPVQPDTRFAAASITKPAVGLAVLRLVQQGVLDLDVDVNDYLTTWKLPNTNYTQKAKVTLRWLLCHGAGLTVFGFWGYRPAEPVPTLLQILDGLSPANSAPIRSATAPGHQWSYSSGGYCLIQQLLIDVLHQPFPDLMADLVLSPLDMRASLLASTPPAEQWPLTAHGHDATGAPIADRWRAHPELAAAGLWSTPTDIVKLAIAIQRSRAADSHPFLAPQLVQQVLTPQIANWGLGPALDGQGAAARFAHGGAVLGFRCYLTAYCERGQGAAIMTNGERGDYLCVEILHSLARVYGWPEYYHYLDQH